MLDGLDIATAVIDYRVANRDRMPEDDNQTICNGLIEMLASSTVEEHRAALTAFIADPARNRSAQSVLIAATVEIALMLDAERRFELSGGMLDSRVADLTPRVSVWSKVRRWLNT